MDVIEPLSVRGLLVFPGGLDEACLTTNSLLMLVGSLEVKYILWS